MRQSILKNIAWSGAGSALVKPLWFAFITFFCIRQMGIQEYGVFVAALAITTLLNSILSLGINSYSLRETAKDFRLAGQFLSNLVPFRIASSLAALVLAIGYSALNPASDTGPWVLTLASCYNLGLALADYLRTFFRAQEAFQREAAAIVVEKVLLITCGAALLLVRPEAEWLLGGLSLGMLLSVLVHAWWLRRSGIHFYWRSFDAGFLRSIVPKALPLGLGGIFIMVYYQADTIILESLESNVVVGQYGLAFRFIEVLMILPEPIVSVLYPRLSSLWHTSQTSDFRRLITAGSAGVLAIALTATACVHVAAPWLIGLAAPGEPIAPVVQSLRILLWTLPFAGACYLLSTALTAADDQNILSGLLGLAAIFNVALNVILIPAYSLQGACIAMVATQILLFTMLLPRLLHIVKRGHTSTLAYPFSPSGS